MGDFGLGQLRHLYSHMVNGRLGDPKEAAEGLLAKGIEYVEKLQREHEALKAEWAQWQATLKPNDGWPKDDDLYGWKRRAGKMQAAWEGCDTHRNELLAQLEAANNQLTGLRGQLLGTIENGLGMQQQRNVANKELERAKAAWRELRANMSVSQGSSQPVTMRGVWFKGGDKVAQVEALDAILGTNSAEPKKAIDGAKEAVVTEAAALVRSGYDGPFMGEEVAPLIRAVIALERPAPVRDPVTVLRSNEFTLHRDVAEQTVALTQEVLRHRAGCVRTPATYDDQCAECLRLVLEFRRPTTTAEDEELRRERNEFQMRAELHEEACMVIRDICQKAGIERSFVDDCVAALKERGDAAERQNAALIGVLEKAKRDLEAWRDDNQLSDINCESELGQLLYVIDAAIAKKVGGWIRTEQLSPVLRVLKNVGDDCEQPEAPCGDCLVCDAKKAVVILEEVGVK